MIRSQPPFNGKRYLANTNTQEIHDLLNEKPACRIDKMSKKYIKMLDGFQEALDLINFPHNDWNGCAYCLSGLYTE